MFLTVSKRVEFSASRRLHVRRSSAAENLAAFGPETGARFGTGRNYVAYFVFSGEVDPTNGMLMNISEIKNRVGLVLHEKFDHKFLNEDNPDFAETPPTNENVARQLFRDVAPLFAASDAKLVACHLRESEARSATFYENGAADLNVWFGFSAARQTMSPHLNREENTVRFGAAASPHGHGHYYRARLTLRPDAGASASDSIPHERISEVVDSLLRELDHKNLNHEVAALQDRPITTESLAAFLFDRARDARLPIARVRLFERPDFFAEHWGEDRYFLGMQQHFSAAHRLHSSVLSQAENLELYGKCNNERGHGHRYLVEGTIGGVYDPRSGTLYDFEALRDGMSAALLPWQDKHLDRETEEFRARPSTGENIVDALWPRMDCELSDRLARLRLWETPNNRFTLRRGREADGA